MVLRWWEQQKPLKALKSQLRLQCKNQKLINDALRRLVDAGNEEEERKGIKNDLLRDKEFLKILKIALAT